MSDRTEGRLKTINGRWHRLRVSPWVRVKRPRGLPSAAAAAALAVSLIGLPQTARADGCTVLLCLAGNWRNISQCVPPVRKALRDLALGRSFPMCAFAELPSLPGWNGSSGTTSQDLYPQHNTAPRSGASLRWAQDGFCPPQYRTPLENESGAVTHYLCDFMGAIEVSINGQLWNRTWWSVSGDSVTEWTEAARSSLPQAAADDRFERDYLLWLHRQPAAPPTPSGPPQPEGGA
jgi:hypothetical protein